MKMYKHMEETLIKDSLTVNTKRIEDLGIIIDLHTDAIIQSRKERFVWFILGMGSGALFGAVCMYLA